MRLFSQFTSWDNSKDPDRPLVIGYVSPDYFTHSVSYFIEAPLVHHDYTKYKVIVYSAVVKVSFMNGCVQNAIYNSVNAFDQILKLLWCIWALHIYTR